MTTTTKATAKKATATKKEVKAKDIVKAINEAPEGVTQTTQKIELDGKVTTDDLKVRAGLEIGGGSITTASIKSTSIKIRGFEVAKGFEDKGINLPERQTANSAGYDFEASEDVVIEPLWKNLWKLFRKNAYGQDMNEKILKPTLVPTGVKAYMTLNESLDLYNRSSNPLKRFLLLGNGVGLIDSDYYNNPDNDGHIMFQFINFGFFPQTIKKGERIGQGVFRPFLKADGDKATGTRTGGHGSTKN
ncbi:hypothetical protein [Bacillus sp. ISTL8]|uniref:hypothetical protein n=1 Tax=Bacillus sp. ISTL8 TaxID=2596896 RepID=UPI001ABF6628|nr:hypothetical protein [Bacillus sp. ISTL8]